MTVSIYIMSLGCPRNLLDSEILQGILEEKGFKISENPELSDIAIVNTCGFVEDAKKESVDIILQFVELKKEGKIKKLIVTGCLSQRYPQELQDEIKEIDAMFGTSDFVKIPQMIELVLKGEKIKDVSQKPDFLYDHTQNRHILTPGHYAYIKIQEGCSNRCSYCVIPDLRGPLRSRTVDSVLQEVKKVTASGNVRELILIGQDITSFGRDKQSGDNLAELLKRISKEAKNIWIRLLYTHPAHFTEDLIDVIAENDNICNYVDLPIQHINSRILKDMNRQVSKEEISELIAKLRSRIKGIIIRTTIIVGFPGETDEEFSELLSFLEDTRFDRLGAFIYSQEEGTKAAVMKNQVPDDVKKQRLDAVMSLQQDISLENNMKYVGKTLKVLMEGQVEGESDKYIARSYMDAPEVDGMIYVISKAPKIGEFCDVKITGTMEYDLIGEEV